MPRVTVDITEKHLEDAVRNKLKGLRAQVTRLERKNQGLTDKVRKLKLDADFYEHFMQTFRSFFDDCKYDFED